MTLYTFRKSDARTSKVDNHSTRRTLRFYGKNIYPSVLLAEMLGLYAGAHIAISVDEDDPKHVYIRRADDSDDNSRTQTARVCSDCIRKGTLVFSAKAVCDYISELVGHTNPTLFVSPVPIYLNNKKFYRILTETPLYNYGRTSQHTTL